MMGVGSDLVEPQLAAGQHLNGEILSKIFTQRTIWLVPKEKLCDDDLQEEDTLSVALDEPIFMPSIIQTQPAHESQTASGPCVLETKPVCESQAYTSESCVLETQPACESQTSNAVCVPDIQTACESEAIANLKAIFPDKTDIYLNEKLENSNGDLQQAVLSILHEQDPTDTHVTQDVFDLPLCTVREPPHRCLERYQAKFIDDGSRRQLISIQRSSNSIIRDLLKEYKRGSIDILKVPDVEFIGEEGIDAKGLSREFCHIMMSCLRDGKGGVVFFEGEMNHLLPVHCAAYVASHYFFYVGKMIAHSVLHSSIGMVGLSRALSTLLVTGDMEKAMLDLTVSDVPDVELRATVEKIQSAETDEELGLTGSELLLLTEAGFANEMLTVANKHRACQCLMTHLVFRTRREEIDQMREGLESVSLISFLQVSEACWRVAFPNTDDVKISAQAFLDLIPKTWVAGLLGKEKETMEWFTNYVNDVEGGIKEADEGTLSSLPSMAELTQFVVGHPYLPPEQLKISFGAGPYPDPDACFLSITLPVNHTCYSEFRKAMNTAITAQCVGFGRG